MTKIAFWNVQRLGKATAKARANVIRERLNQWSPDLSIYCELTTRCTNPTPLNLTYRRRSAAQLCYGAKNSASQDVPMTAYTPRVTQAYKSSSYKHGSDFTRLADRAVADAGTLGGVHVYAIHAPAGSGCQVMAFIASSLNETYGDNPWLIIGDFNCVPDELKKTEKQIGIVMDDLIRNSGWMTHLAANGSMSELDYVLCNFPAVVKAQKVKQWWQSSDHSPILVQY